MRTLGFLALALVAILVVEVTLAQQPPRGRFPQQPGRPTQPGGGDRTGGGPRGERESDYKLPDDPRLVQLHKTFVEQAMKLGAEYERTNQIDKARTCYAEILRLVPTYTDAKDKLEQVRAKEASADRKVMDVLANRGWQDTGIDVEQGRPLVIKADGNWTFRMSYQVDANGIAIPSELRDFNLGALVGIIAPPGASSSDEMKDVRPFFIGAASETSAPRAGRLYLRMYDADPSDNVGKVSVTITGTFKK